VVEDNAILQGLPQLLIILVAHLVASCGTVLFNGANQLSNFADGLTN